MFYFDSFDVANATLVFIIMFGVGASLDLEAAKKHFNQKVALIAGSFNQYAIAPLLFWGFSQMDDEIPLQFRAGMIIIGTCPGGVLSNVVCMWLHADPSLSITLTSWTVLLSLGALPLNLFIYLDVAGLGTPPNSLQQNQTTYQNSSNPFHFQTDWIGISVSFVSVIGGVLLGILIQFLIKSKRILKRLELLGIITCIPQAALALTANVKSDAPVWKMPGLVYVLLLSPTLVLFFLALISGHYVLKLPKPSSTALAVEASIQNVNVAIGILSLSINDPELRAQSLGVPLAHATIELFLTLLFGLALWKFGWTELDPHGTNPFTVWCREYYHTAFKGSSEELSLKEPRIDEDKIHDSVRLSPQAVDNHSVI